MSQKCHSVYTGPFAHVFTRHANDIPLPHLKGQTSTVRGILDSFIKSYPLTFKDLVPGHQVDKLARKVMGISPGVPPRERHSHHLPNYSGSPLKPVLTSEVKMAKLFLEKWGLVCSTLDHNTGTMHLR